MADEERRSLRDRIRALFGGKKKTCETPCDLDIDEQPQPHLAKVARAQQAYDLQSINDAAPSDFPSPLPILPLPFKREKKEISLDPLARSLSGFTPHWTPAAVSPLERFYHDYIIQYDERVQGLPGIRNKNKKSKKKVIRGRDNTIDSVTSLVSSEEWTNDTNKYSGMVKLQEGSTQTEDNPELGHKCDCLCKKSPNVIGGQSWLADIKHENASTSMGALMSDPTEKSIQVVDSNEKHVAGTQAELPGVKNNRKSLFSGRGIDVNINFEKAEVRVLEEHSKIQGNIFQTIFVNKTVPTTAINETPSFEVACSAKTNGEDEMYSQVHLEARETPMNISGENVYINIGGEHSQIDPHQRNKFLHAGSIQISKYGKGKTQSKMKSGKKMPKHHKKCIKDESTQGCGTSEESKQNLGLDDGSTKYDKDAMQRTFSDQETLSHITFEEWLSTVGTASKPDEVKITKTAEVDAVGALLQNDTIESSGGTADVCHMLHVTPLPNEPCHEDTVEVGHYIVDGRNNTETSQSNDLRATTDSGYLNCKENTGCEQACSLEENLEISPVRNCQVLDVNEHHSQMENPDQDMDYGPEDNSTVDIVIQDNMDTEHEQISIMDTLHVGSSKDLGVHDQIDLHDSQAKSFSVDDKFTASNKMEHELTQRDEGRNEQGICDELVTNLEELSHRGSSTATTSRTAEFSVCHANDENSVSCAELGDSDVPKDVTRRKPGDDHSRLSQSGQNVENSVRNQDKAIQTNANERRDEDDDANDTFVSDETGMIDVYRMKKKVEDQSRQLNKCIIKFRSRTDKMARLLKYMDQLKAETEEMKRLMAGVDKETAAMRDEAAEMRCTVSAVCDLSVSTIGKETEAKRREPACYRRYLNIRSSSDAANALLAVRNRIKALNDLEVLIYRKQLVLHHVLPTVVQEKTPVAKRANRPAVKGPKPKRTDQSTSGEATGNIVIEVVAPSADATTPSWSEEISHTDSPLTISTAPVSGSNDERSEPVQILPPPDTEV